MFCKFRNYTSTNHVLSPTLNASWSSSFSSAVAWYMFYIRTDSINSNCLQCLLYFKEMDKEPVSTSFITFCIVNVNCFFLYSFHVMNLMISSLVYRERIGCCLIKEVSVLLLITITVMNYVPIFSIEFF